MAIAEARTMPPSARATPNCRIGIERRRKPRLRLSRRPQRQGRVRPEKQGRDGKDNDKESGLCGESGPKDGHIPDRREPRPVDCDARDAPEREQQDDDGDQHANASQEHAPYASRGPGQGLTAAAVWVNDGNWRQARAVVRRKPSFGLAFPGDRRTDDNFRLLSLLGQAYPRRGDASLPRLLGLYFRVRVNVELLVFIRPEVWSAILGDTPAI